MKRIVAWMKKDVVEKVNTSRLFKDETVKLIFDNIRNTSLAGLVYWAGLVLYMHPAESFPQVELFVGGLLILSALGLFVINVIHGIKKILELSIHKVVAVIVSVAFYFAVCGYMSALARTKQQEVGRVAQPSQATRLETGGFK
ncbi:MAG TPA: hypothetical protein VFW68_06525 [Rhodocyclaceae bacterium]|nr:hypothetical protein [Rhodocyclaceae bacterium]